MRAAFHRMLWRRLPRHARRAALFRLTGYAAPRLDPAALPAEPIVVAGCLRSATGLGESARLSYSALRADGLDVRGIDLSPLLMQPDDLADFTFRDGHAALGRGTLLVHVNAPLMPLVLLSLGRRMIRHKWVVGYWAWELPAVPPEWVAAATLAHEVWVPSRFVAAAVRARMEAVSVRVLPHPVGAGLEPPVGAATRRGDRPFTALCVFNMGSSMARKNPLAAIDAFQQAFPERPDVRLIVKIANPELFPAGAAALAQKLAGQPNAVLVDRTLTPAALAQIYAASDCLLSLHRAEGFGLTIAEAMRHGVPAISTDWSGPTDFVTKTNGYPVGYRLIPAEDPQGTYDFPELSWADADLAAAASALRAAREQGDGRGEAAREDARRLFSAQRYAASVRSFLALD